MSVEQDLAGQRLVQPQQQVDQRGLAGTIGAGDGHDLPGEDGKADVAQCVAPVGVGEADMLESDRTFDGAQLFSRIEAVFDFVPEHALKSGHRPARALDLAIEVRQCRSRTGE